MKKVYIKPTVETVTIGMQHIIAASGLSFGDDGNGGGLLNDESADDGVDALSRGLFDF